MSLNPKEDRVHFGADETTIPLKKNYLYEVDSIVKTPVIYKDGRSATKFQKTIFGSVVFENPKDHQVISEIISYCCKPGGIVLDFFAGSGTTGHAAWLSSISGVNFRFILVQLPEKLDPEKKQHKNACALGFKKISDVTIERLKRTGDLLKSDAPEELDFGFKVFELSSSNVRSWSPDKKNLEETLLSQKESLVEGRSEQDVLYELLLKRGIDLATPIETRTLAGKTVYCIGGGVIFACLSPSLISNDIETLAQGILGWHSELDPETDTHVFFRDGAFPDDIVKTNLAAILEQNGISHVRSL